MVHNSIRQAMRVLPFSFGHMYPHSHSNPPTPSPFHVSPLPESRTPPLMSSSLPGSHLHQHHGYRSPITAPPGGGKQLLPPDFLHSLCTRCRQTFIAPVLSIYLADLFSAARHHPRLDGTFLTVRAMEDAEDLVRASRVLGMDPTGSELVRNPDNSYADDEYFDENDDQITPNRHYDSTEDVGNGSVTANPAMDEVRSDPSTIGGQDPETLYVSEADIARIVPRVITHRLRVRDGPQDEVLSSAVFGATFGNYADDSGRGYPRNTVKDVLVGILGDV